jgi:hypothetical protein
MTNYKEVTIDAITGEKTERDYTEAEIAEAQANQAKADKIAKDYADAQAKKAVLLTKLGITADEAALLLA